MKVLDVYAQVLRDTVRPDMALIDVLLHGVVLHTHSLSLKKEVVLEDVNEQSGGIVLAPLTRHHVAEMLAKLWPSNTQRGQEDYWFAHCLADTPYELFEMIPEQLRDRAVAARDSIAGHALLAELVPE